MQKEDYGVECKICVLALAVKLLRPAVGEALHHLPLESRDAGALQGLSERPKVGMRQATVICLCLRASGRV